MSNIIPCGRPPALIGVNVPTIPPTCRVRMFRRRRGILESGTLTLRKVCRFIAGAAPDGSRRRVDPALSKGSSEPDPGGVKPCDVAGARPIQPFLHCPRSLDIPAGHAAPRERAILAEICAAKSNKHIARTLDMSEKTVRNHATIIFSKLGVSARQEAIVKVRGG